MTDHTLKKIGGDSFVLSHPSRVVQSPDKTVMTAALGWTISDIKGISPSICMHKILMEESYKPLIKHQRRLNPVMKEVVRTKILKLLNTGIIYAISNSSWVSLV